MRGSAGDDKPDPVEPAGLAALLGQDQMAEMDRVERAAEKSQSHSVENSRPIPAIPTAHQTTVHFLVDKRAEIG